MKNIILRLEQRIEVNNIINQRENLSFVSVPKDQLTSAISFLKDFENFKHLVFITPVDYIERNVFQITYMLHNYERKCDIGLRIEIDREKPEMYSIHEMWKQASTYQREMKEMYGIEFPGSPRLNDNFVLEGWDNIPPMRRDFDTKKYSDETYFPRPGRKTYDPKTYMKEQLYPDPKK
jgi:NADH-quinone oxidoreductase subunit C